ncbi:cyclase family protein [Candidatus Omnitrophota bacterium]
MKYIDISRTVRHGMTKYPSDPDVKVRGFKSLKDGSSCNLSILEMGSHAGTHVDAPLHVLERGKGVDRLRLSDLICDVFVAGTRAFFRSDPSESIRSKGVKGVLFKDGRDGSFLTLEQAKILVRYGIKIVGVESMSIERSSDKSHPIHRALLAENVVIIEGLNLKRVKAGCYRLICLPLKIKAGDGAPARAVLEYD